MTQYFIGIPHDALIHQLICHFLQPKIITWVIRVVYTVCKTHLTYKNDREMVKKEEKRELPSPNEKEI